MRKLSLMLTAVAILSAGQLSAAPGREEISAEPLKPEQEHSREIGEGAGSEEATHEATHIVQQQGKSSRVETRGWDVKNKEPIEEKPE